MTQVLRTIDQVRSWHQGRDVAAVYTMGALHAGHAELIRAAQRECGVVIASIFVNPTQFGDTADLTNYPRTWDQDLALLESLGTDAVFAPTVDQMYPHSGIVTVLTVVSKLLHITQPAVAAFGEKDYQQLSLIRRMVHDLNFPTRIMGVPTVRDLDGLALSSRNARLDRAARQQAAAIPAALRQVGAALSQGASVQAAADEGHALLHNAGIVDVDYLVVTGEDLGPVPTVGPARALVAATVGGVHLIDNIAVEI